MSRLSDYSKFDHLDENDSDDEPVPRPQNEKSKSAAQPASPASVTPSAEASEAHISDTVQGPRLRKDQSTGRFVFEYDGHPIYEFEQTLDDVTIYVSPPPFIQSAKQLNCVIQPNHLRLGVQGSDQWFINEATFGLVDMSESTWSLEEDAGKRYITIYLIKARRGQLWEAALKGAAGKELDPAAKEEVKKQLLLERFQEENPGMDFRDADFNGEVPDARTFMGGVSYS